MEAFIFTGGLIMGILIGACMALYERHDDNGE